MTTWAIIPIKQLSEAKSSLGSALTPQQRRKLVLCMLEDILSAIERSHSVSGVIVVSPDAEVLDLASSAGAVAVTDPGLGLNNALEVSIDRVKESGGGAALILPGDVPLLSPTDIREIVGLASGERDVVIATSERKGTNALLLQPPDVMGLHFGGKSFPLHLEEASRAGLTPHIYQSERVAADIDEVSDLAKIETLGRGTRSHKFVRSLRA